MRPNKLVLAAFSLSLLLSLTPSTTSAEVADPVQPYRAGDLSQVALNILPPGQGRYLNTAELVQNQTIGFTPDENVDQREPYASLIQGLAGLTEDNLTDYFKDASFGVQPGDEGRTYSPREGVTVIRDTSYNVPHVYGETREDTMFGAGYVSAEDRLFMMDVLRHYGRGRLTEFLGPSEANLAIDCAQNDVADYTDPELREMVENRPPGTDQELAQTAMADLESYVDGVNAFIQEALLDPRKLPGEYPALQKYPKEWKIADTVAVASLIGG
ncbi:MAG: penicillin acylase family protein, partial [Actinomycetota bacterium]|nr:penicillin acylase family protein [Actinomycetota bacterium]